MILFVLAVIGMTHILVSSEIMDPVDDWARTWMPPQVHRGLFECYQCAGFWCGMLLGMLLVSINPVTIFACGCAGSFVADLSESLFKIVEK